MNDERERLARELKTRSHDVGGHPFGMDEVRQRARGIVWRRRIATGAVAAAVLAVAVPAGLAATGGTNRGIGPIDHPSPTVTHATPSPSPDESPTPDPSPSPTFPAGAIPLTTVDLQQGSAPAIIYLDGTTLHNGSETEQLPTAYQDITSYHGGWLALEVQNGGYSAVQLDPNGTITSTQPSAAGLAVDEAGRTAWFVAGAPGQPGQLVAGIGSGMSNGESSVPVPTGTTAHPVGFAGQGLVFDTDGVNSQVFVTDFSGSKPTPVPGALKAGGASPALNRISVLTKVTDAGSCWAVVDTSGTADWSTCDYTLGQFSLNGKYLAAYPSYFDGLGPSSVTILDAHTSKPVADFQRPPGSDLFVGDVAWEDDTHLLATVHENGAWQIVRLGTDGSVEAASPAVPGGDSNCPFFFSARP